MKPALIRNIGALLCLLMISCGCRSLRLHDTGRLDISQKAAELSKQLSELESDPFSTMESNLATVIEAHNITVAAEFELEMNTFYTLLESETVSNAFTTFTANVLQHDQIRTSLSNEVTAAAINVRDKLADQQLLSARNLTKTNDLLTIINSVTNQLDKLNTTLKKITTALDGAGITPPDTKTVGELSAKIQKILNEVTQDTEVQSASRLELEAARAAVLFAKSRLSEANRHLNALNQIKLDFDSRDVTFKTRLKSSAEGRLRTWNSDDPKKMLIERLNAELKGDMKEAALKAMAAYALIQAVEIPLDKNAERQAAVEEHRHSILLSRINAQQRFTLVNQLAQALVIYYQGGIKPEEIAKLALLATQAVAVTKIATD